MLSKLYQKLFTRKPGYLSAVSQDKDSKKFELLYGNNPIGYLQFADGVWHFEYSDWFKNQDRIVPLIEFPEKDKKYRSKALWSFFSSRIPSQENIDSKKGDMVNLSLSELLEKFGKQTINNPFILKPF